MKKSLSLLLLTATIIVSCKKESNKTTSKSDAVVLLKKVTNSLPGDPDIGKTLVEFTYNDKQLSKAVLYSYSGVPTSDDIETDLFNYDSQGHLTGTTIIHTQSNTYDYVSSTVTYNGNNISEIKFYKAGNILDKDIKITYQDGKLINWFNSDEVNDTYSYDASDHEFKELALEYQSGKPDGEQYEIANTTFDDKFNLSGSVPFWIYFRSYHEDQSLTYTPGKNNPIIVNDSGTNFTYNYQYNSYGYPSEITFNNGYPQSYRYDYIQVN